MLCRECLRPVDEGDVHEDCRAAVEDYHRLADEQLVGKKAISRRSLFGLFGAGGVVAVTRALPVAERVAPKTWDTIIRAGRLHYWDGVKWVKAFSNKYLVR